MGWEACKLKGMGHAVLSVLVDQGTKHISSVWMVVCFSVSVWSSPSQQTSVPNIYHLSGWSAFLCQSGPLRLSGPAYQTYIICLDGRLLFCVSLVLLVLVDQCTKHISSVWMVVCFSVSVWSSPSQQTSVPNIYHLSGWSAFLCQSGPLRLSGPAYQTYIICLDGRLLFCVSLVLLVLVDQCTKHISSVWMVCFSVSVWSSPSQRTSVPNTSSGWSSAFLCQSGPLHLSGPAYQTYIIWVVVCFSVSAWCATRHKRAASQNMYSCDQQGCFALTNHGT